jgi:hypothetical protein
MRVNDEHEPYLPVTVFAFWVLSYLYDNSLT